MKKDLEQMSKIELLEYAKRARYMLGKMYHERTEIELELHEAKKEIGSLMKMIHGDKPLKKD